MSRQPPSSWASVYDLAYQQTFGSFYTQLTDSTVEAILNRIQPPARIVDFGAGTGRLTIPLAAEGYEVTAVEPCNEMLVQLQQKIQQGSVETVCSSMEDYRRNNCFDLAVCVFTVILYLLDEDTLLNALRSAHAALKPGGLLMIDVPARGIFQGYTRKDDLIQRTVTVSSQPGDLYRYREELHWVDETGHRSTCEDEFLIRYWPADHVLQILNTLGFVLQEDLSTVFSGSGSNYFLMKKTDSAGRVNM